MAVDKPRFVLGHMCSIWVFLLTYIDFSTGWREPLYDICKYCNQPENVFSHTWCVRSIYAQINLNSMHVTHNIHSPSIVSVSTYLIVTSYRCDDSWYLHNPRFRNYLATIYICRAQVQSLEFQSLAQYHGTKYGFSYRNHGKCCVTYFDGEMKRNIARRMCSNSCYAIRYHLLICLF